jgi:hypothetical protein
MDIFGIALSIVSISRIGWARKKRIIGKMLLIITLIWLCDFAEVV